MRLKMKDLALQRVCKVFQHTVSPMTFSGEGVTWRETEKAVRKMAEKEGGTSLILLDGTVRIRRDEESRNFSVIDDWPAPEAPPYAREIHFARRLRPERVF